LSFREIGGLFETLAFHASLSAVRMPDRRRFGSGFAASGGVVSWRVAVVGAGASRGFQTGVPAASAAAR
jgi:hypothetical protein